MDTMGTVQLVDAPEQDYLPQLRRLDLAVDYATETGVFHCMWRVGDKDMRTPLASGKQAEGNLHAAVLNGVEQVLPMAPETMASFPVAEGINRFEVITAFTPIKTVVFDKMSSHAIRLPSWLTSMPLPETGVLRQLFARWHEREETIRHPDGSWGGGINKGARCLCHEGAFHMLPYALAYQYLDPKPVYRERLRGGADRILSLQHAEGWYPDLCLDENPSRFRGGAFATGSAGEIMAIAYAILKDDAYRESSMRAADAYRWYTFEINENYAAFPLWHLAELYEQFADSRYLEQAVFYGRYFAGRDIGPCGSQDGHNYYTAYANITLKGLARLLRILPPDHPAYPSLRARVLRFANQALTRLQPDGYFAGRNRRYVGYKHFVPGLFEVARALPETASVLAPVFARMCAAAERMLAEEDHEGYLGLALACMARYRTEISDNAPLLEIRRCQVN